MTAAGTAVKEQGAVFYYCRLMALAFDFVVVSVIASLIYILLLVLTLGLSFFFLPPLWPIVAFFYSGATMSGPRHATPGMRAMNLDSCSGFAFVLSAVLLSRSTTRPRFQVATHSTAYLRAR